MLFLRDDVVDNLYNYHQLSQISRDIQLPLVQIYILQDTHQTVNIIFSNFANGFNFDHNFVRQERKKTSRSVFGPKVNHYHQLSSASRTTHFPLSIAASCKLIVIVKLVLCQETKGRRFYVSLYFLFISFFLRHQCQCCLSLRAVWGFVSNLRLYLSSKLVPRLILPHLHHL